MKVSKVLLAAVATSALLSSAALNRVFADVAMRGTFTATQACPALQSIRKSTNPGDVKIEPETSYELISKNKSDATHYRIVVNGAEPEERWVAVSCGRVGDESQPAQGASRAPAPPSAGNQPTPIPASPADPSASGGQRATHVLAMSWQPTFCQQHREKPECAALRPDDFAAKNLSLHGLWPQPRGTQYCNVKPEVSQLDEDHNWNALPEPELSAGTRKRLSAVMPGVQSNLQRHEWIVHGTCFGTDADVYFARAAGLAEAINASKVSKLFADNVGKAISANDIVEAFDQSFGAGAGARVTVSCRGKGEGRKITELIISLAGDVKGSDAIGDLMRAAQPARPGCPGGFVQQPQS